ncbi:4Fe-4S dicluster domain-containing protein [Thermobrachium celere]|uniref:4Fe-4S dicluster domain-containing protein n=1 Tax=Thermobrachium celere TaxID=53422 RepID=UPI0019405AC9|nr:4Fe-4S dicluster domain-containing protein [Thermobrachium celere]GFR35704.1 hypothetical protein TCEA9_15160 [Thermobrachium celere]
MKYKLSLKIKDIVEKYNDKCYGCNLCTNHCIFLKKYIKNPKIFFQNLSIENDIDIYLPYYCFSCNTCSQICPNNIDFGILFTELKKEISKNKKKPSY